MRLPCDLVLKQSGRGFKRPIGSVVQFDDSVEQGQTQYFSNFYLELVNVGMNRTHNL